MKVDYAAIVKAGRESWAEEVEAYITPKTDAAYADLWLAIEDLDRERAQSAAWWVSESYRHHIAAVILGVIKSFPTFHDAILIKIDEAPDRDDAWREQARAIAMDVGWTIAHR